MAWFKCKFNDVEPTPSNFPMGQNDNGNLNLSLITNYFNNTYSQSKGKNWLVAYNYTSGSYVYIKFFIFDKNVGNIFATINDDKFTPYVDGASNVKNGNGYYNPSNSRFYNMSSSGGLGSSFNNSVSSKKDSSKSYISNFEMTDGNGNTVLSL